MAKRLVVFNHKGGVSKTTSSYNIGWMIAKTHRVLLVDADSQCNLTALILGDEFEKYYTDDETKRNNIKDGVLSGLLVPGSNTQRNQLARQGKDGRAHRYHGLAARLKSPPAALDLAAEPVAALENSEPPKVALLAPKALKSFFR